MRPHVHEKSYFILNGKFKVFTKESKLKCRNEFVFTNIFSNSQKQIRYNIYLFFYLHQLHIDVGVEEIVNTFQGQVFRVT